MLSFRPFAIMFCALSLSACSEFANDDFDTGSIATPDVPLSLVAPAAVAPATPQEHAAQGRLYLDKGLYGLAETEFRAAVELKPRNAEAWLGLAAAYDNLRRFDLADRAYAQVKKLLGDSAELLNNEGYSQLMRGNLKKARAMFEKAQAQAPDNPVIADNIKKVDAALTMNLPKVM